MDGMNLPLERDFAKPQIQEILAAVPLLQWRRCWECGAVALHAKNVTPDVCCRACGSQDTRQLTRENRLLRGEQ